MLVDAWWDHASRSFLQIAAIAIVAFAAEWVFRGPRWTALRATAWLLVLARCVIPTSFSSPVSLGPDLYLISPSQTPREWCNAAFALWAAGAASVAILTILRSARFGINLRRERAQAPPRPARAALVRACRTLQIRRMPKLQVTRAVSSPALCGIFRPVVLIPANGGETAEEYYHIFLHELLHLRRRDPLISFAARIIQIGFWYHPAVWIAGTRSAALREMHCDHAVARTLNLQIDGYRATLAQAALRADDLHRAGVALTGFGGGASVLRRLQFLDAQPWRFARISRIGAVMFLLFSICCILPMAARASVRSAEYLQFARRTETAIARGESISCLQIQAAAFAATAVSDK